MNDRARPVDALSDVRRADIKYDRDDQRDDALERPLYGAHEGE